MMNHPPPPQYNPKAYWEALLQQRFDLRDVGYPNLSLAFNNCLYRAMADSVERGLRRLHISENAWCNSSVLDVGSGTGFWIEFWMAKGVQRLIGMDLTAKSVSSLAQRYPQLTFQQRDIADPLDTSLFNSFDLISAMSILHHIPSQPRWERALINLGRMLKSGGYLLIMDPILKHQWWGKPFDSSSTGRPRTIVEHKIVLDHAGVVIKFVIPTVVILANPVDARWKLEYQLLAYWWRQFSRIAARDWLMSRCCSFVYALDRLLCRLNYMPSSKVLVCHRELAP